MRYVTCTVLINKKKRSINKNKIDSESFIGNTTNMSLHSNIDFETTDLKQLVGSQLDG